MRNPRPAVDRVGPHDRADVERKAQRHLHGHELRSRHYLPTYVTPRPTLIIEALDADDTVWHSSKAVIQRRVDLYLTAQPYDTRLVPGACVPVDLSWDRRS